MPSISSCPECHRDLTIPDVADRQQPLRCPLCDAQFLAERVLAESVNFPPTAIVVSGGDSPAPVAATQDDAVSEGPTDNVGDATLPTTSESTHVDEQPAAVDEPTQHEPSPMVTLHDTGAGEDVAREAVETTDEAPDSSAIDPATSTEFESFGQKAATMRMAPRTKQQAGPFWALGQLLGVVLGGVLGLAIGYWVLVWIGGPQRDFLQLRGKVPRWLMPPRRHSDAGQSGPLASQDTSHFGQAGRTLGDLLKESDSPQETPAGDERTADNGGLSISETQLPTRADELPVTNEAKSPSRHLSTQPFSESYRGPLAFKPRTVSELTTVLDKAERALRCPHCQAPGAVRLAAFTAPANDVNSAIGDVSASRRCDYCRGKPPTNLTTTAFDQLCELAEIVTFVRFEGDDPRRDECRQAAEAIVLALGAQRERSEIAGRLAGERLDNSQRQSNGILLAGTVQQAESEGDLFAIQIILLGCGKSVTVLSRRPPEPPVERRDRVVVLGSIVDSPRDNLAGYVGNLPQVVWGGLPLKLASLPR